MTNGILTQKSNQFGHLWTKWKIFAHNHPSGNPQPSKSDHAVTALLQHALALIDVRVLDHFVVAGGKIHSFAEHGEL